MPTPKKLNPDYVWFLFVKSPETPKNLTGRIERWLFAKSPLARWVETNAKHLMEILPSYPDPVVVFWWPSSAEQAVVDLSKELERQPEKPKVMILRERPASRQQEPANSELDKFAKRYEALSVLDPDPAPDKIREGLKKLGVWLRLETGFTLALEITSTDPALYKMLETTDRNVLRRLIAWHFPMAARARVFPVEGGWSGTRLCRFYVDGNVQEYFLKLHEYAGDYATEFSRHREAEFWLKKEEIEGPMERRVVELVPVDEAPVDPKDAQKRIFSGGPFWPVCYKSASEETKRRETWQWLFSRCGAKFQLDVLHALIETLALGNHPPKYSAECLWSLAGTIDQQGAGVDRHRKLVFTLDTRVALEKALDDLEPYGQVMCEAAPDGSTWKSRKEELSLLVDGHLPKWLQEGPHYVALGHIHGDPNPRNCMVKAGDPNNPEDPGNPKDIQLIDFGNYLNPGRLVWDLAIIERDIKLVLMQASSDDQGYKDLDPDRLARWCELERRLTAELAFVAKAQTPLPDPPLAEQLLQRVRKRAQELSVGNGPVPLDPQGYHYFAALLYCTLDILKEEAVRRTKKLLALYSASEILRKFK
jgi:hypothetical protein